METIRLLVLPDTQVRLQLSDQPGVSFRIKEDPLYRDATKWANSEDDFSFTPGQTVFVFADMGIPDGSIIKFFQYDKQTLTPDDYTASSTGFTLGFAADDVYINLGYQ